MVSSKIIYNNILRITLDNNPVNSITISMLKDLYNAIHNIKYDNIRCIIFDSNSSHFCAGADLKERSKFSKNDTLEFLDNINEFYHFVESIQVPTFAFINGACLGGGLELAISCDFRIAFKNSIFGFPETSIGIIPGAGGTQRLTRLIGSSKSLKWIFTSDKFNVQEAFQDGVVDFVIDKEDKEIFISKFISKISKNAPLAIKAAKNSINSAFINHGFIKERQEYLTILSSEDRKEGLLAFKEKRISKWINK